MARNHLVSAALAAAFVLTACGGGSSGQGVVPQGGSLEQSSALALQPSLGLGPANGYYPLTAPGAAHPVCPQPPTLTGGVATLGPAPTFTRTCRR